MGSWLKVAEAWMLKQAALQIGTGAPSVRSMLGQSGPLGDLTKRPSEQVKSLSADTATTPTPVVGPLSGMPQLGTNQLAGRSRLNTTIQMNGPLSTTGDFGNPNAARNVIKTPELPK